MSAQSLSDILLSHMYGDRKDILTPFAILTGPWRTGRTERDEEGEKEYSKEGGVE